MSNQVMQKAFVEKCLSDIQQYDVGDMPAIRSRSFSPGDTVVVPEKGSIVGEGILTFTGYLSEVNRTDAQNAYGNSEKGFQIW